MRLLMSFIALVTVVAGCGGGGGASSPEELAKSVVAAMASADPEAMKALLPPDELLGKAMACKDAASGYPERVKKFRAGIDKDAAERKAKVKDLKVEYVGFEDKETKTTEKGGEVGSCTANEALEGKKINLKMKITAQGETRDEGESARFIKLDGKWYLLDL